MQDHGAMARGGPGTAARASLDGSGGAPPLGPPPTGPAVPSSPAAARPGRRWRDPRLAFGIALVAVCALLGGRLLGSADDTVSVWSARVPLQAGQRLAAGDLVARHVRFADQADADRYLSAEQPLGPGTVLERAVGTGELVPRAALGSGDVGVLTDVPLSVDSDRVPATLSVGSTVDVWSTPDRAAASAHASGTPRAALVLHDVPVRSLPGTATSLGPTATRQVIVGVGPDQAEHLPTALAALAGGTVVVTARR
jgi:hypothetical protein